MIPEIHTKYSLREAGRGWWRSSHSMSGDDPFAMVSSPSQKTCIVKNKLGDTLSSSLYQKLYNGMHAEHGQFVRDNDPQGLVLDAFKHWYKTDKEISVTPEKYWWHHLLSKLDNHLLRRVTNDKIGYSYLAANATLKILEKLYKKYGDDLKDKLDKLSDELCNGSCPSDEELQGDIQRAANSAQNSLKKDIEGLENSKMAGKCNDPANLQMITLATDPRLKKLTNIKGNDLDKFLKTTIDRATSTVSGKYSTREESIFDTDDIEDLINIEAFAHVALVMDAMVKEKQYHLSFDVYIDDSGSMDSHCRLGGNVSVTYRDLSRMVAFKLHQLGILRDVYLFAHENTITLIKPEHLFSAHIGGGTDIQQCIDLARSNRRPAILITDGWDRIKEGKEGYFQDMFILILQCDRTHYTFKQFLPKKQLMFYTDGEFKDGVVRGDEVWAK
jgi:hypothetical protein